MFKDRPFTLSFIGLAVFLVALGFLGYHLTWYGVPISTVAGEYHRPTSRMLSLDHLPATIKLRPDGTAALLSGQGTVLYQGAWHWDQAERMVRMDAPAWDHRLRVRSTLMGPRLSMRIDTTELLKDQEERDLEIDLVKRAPGRGWARASQHAQP